MNVNGLGQQKEDMMGAIKYMLGLEDHRTYAKEHFEKLDREEEERISQIFNKECTEPPVPSKYDNMTREEKEKMMLDTIYTMARDMERLIWKVNQLERNNRLLKDDLEQTKRYALDASLR